MQKITPFLWFDGKAAEAIKLYTSVFKNSKIIKISYWDKGSPFPESQVMTGVFELDGQKFYAFDAGPQFKFTEAISFFVNCETQEEIDHYWGKLTQNGEESMCGWLKDKFGVSWQIIPTILNKIMSDPAKAGKAAQVFMAMRKLNIEQIVQASIA